MSKPGTPVDATMAVVYAAAALRYRFLVTVGRLHISAEGLIDLFAAVDEWNKSAPRVESSDEKRFVTLRLVTACGATRDIRANRDSLGPSWIAPLHQKVRPSLLAEGDLSPSFDPLPRRTFVARSVVVENGREVLLYEERVESKWEEADQRAEVARLTREAHELKEHNASLQRDVSRYLDMLAKVQGWGADV